MRKLLSLLLLLSSSGFAQGVLRVSPNPRYFTDDSGKPIYLTGSHTWDNFMDSGATDPPPVFDYNAYLNFLVANNHNFFRLWRAEQAKGGVLPVGDNYWFTPMPWARPGPGTALDGKPKYDIHQFNQSYFDRMRARIIAAGQRGIYASVMLFDGWSVVAKVTSQPWTQHPLNVNNNINGINGDPNNNGNGEETQLLTYSNLVTLSEAYAKKVIDTVNDLDNVLYELDNEGEGSATPWQYHMIDYIKNYEATLPKRHPVGMTVEWPGGTNAELYSSNADWISPNGDVNNPPVFTGSKVVLNDTDHLCGICGTRSWVWKTITQGGNPIFMDPYEAGITDWGSTTNYDPDNPNDVSIRRNMGYSRSYAKKMDLLNAVPHPELASTGFCLAKPTTDGEYLVYQPGSGSFNVNLKSTIGTLTVEWLNPADGTVKAGSDISGGATRSFTPPFGGDAVLYLKSGSGNQSGSGNPPTPSSDPLTISNVVASSITKNSAIITWTTIRPADSQVEYGTTTAYGKSSFINTTSVTNHSVSLGGLKGGTLYHYRVKSKEPNSSVVVSGDFTFTTRRQGNIRP